MDLDEIWCVASVCHKQEMINFWWGFRSGSGFWIHIRIRITTKKLIISSLPHTKATHQISSKSVQ